MHDLTRDECAVDPPNKLQEAEQAEKRAFFWLLTLFIVLLVSLVVEIWWILK